ncbi:MAG: hypothetical protein OJF49_002678 [Ktedonobacterales bacterium]|nr:MAG: hypothetical protein OJF49_002678 [Ktedonobacterales bacterium]
MKVSARTARRQSKRGSKLQRNLKHTAGNFAFVVLAAAMVFTLGTIGIVAHNLSTASASGHGSPSGLASGVMSQGPTQDTCGTAGLPACPTTARWITLKSHSPADIIAAARQSPLFNVDRSGGGDYIKDLSHLGPPLFVRCLVSSGKYAMPNFYVIPVNDTSGATIGAAELELNPNSTAILVQAIVTYTKPHPHNVIARMSAQDATAAVMAQHHTSLRASAQPQLVYFPVNAYAQQTGKIVWVSGGEYAGDPVWLVPGADGKDHVVGVDGHVYYTSQLPISV